LIVNFNLYCLIEIEPDSPEFKILAYTLRATCKNSAWRNLVIF